MNEAPVFLLQVSDDPQAYTHEFFIDDEDGEEKLHHRLRHDDRDDVVISASFLTDSDERTDEDIGKHVLKTLIAKQSYWLGFVDAEGNPELSGEDMIQGKTITPDNGVFIEQKISETPLKELAQIADALYVE